MQPASGGTAALFPTRARVSLAMVTIIAGALVMSAAMGVRQTFGLFLGPFSFDHGLPITLVAFAIALHNLVWGVAQPFAGAAADRFGSTAVVAFGAVTYAAGLALAAYAPSGPMLVLGLGVLVGIGISCTSFGVVLGAVGRATPPAQRSMAMGLVSPAVRSGRCCSCRSHKAFPRFQAWTWRCWRWPGACWRWRRWDSSSTAAWLRQRRSNRS